jgi:heterodisulfide reductase subunit B
MMLEHELSRESRRSCPLCHAQIEMVQYSIVEEGEEGDDE